MADREKVVKEWEAVLSRDPLDAPWDLIDETLALLKEQETETIECKMCGHRLQKDWNWCPWCRWEIRQGYNADELT